MAKPVQSSSSGARFARRASVGFGLVTLIAATTAIGTTIFAQDQAEKRDEVLDAYADDLVQAFRAQLAAEKMVAVGRGYLLVSEPEFLDRLNDAEEQLESSLRTLERPSLSARERALLAEVRNAAEQYRAIFDQIPITSSVEPRARQRAILREQLMPRRREVGARLEQLVETKRQVQAEARRAARHMAARTFALVLALSAIAVALSVVLAWRFIQYLAAIYRREQDAASLARSASAAREELLGVVAHDLRNPLSAISMKAASIAHHAVDSRTEERAEAIRRLAARMDTLIGTLLQAARIEAGRLSLAWKRGSVSDLFVAAGETFGPIARAQGVQLELAPPPGELAYWGDPDRVAQVVANLIGNGLKFTAAGGKVRIGAVESGFHIRFEVRDTGPGIAPQHLPRVFDRFWRADDAGGKGTGLGLFIAKGIVEAHRGRIWVESRVGAGSAFIFELPIAPAAQDEPRDNGDRSQSQWEAAAEGRDKATGKPAE